MNKIIDTKEFEDLTEKAHQYKFGKKGWSDWGLLFRFLVVICKLLARETEPIVKKKRKPSAWSVFLGKKLHEGKTIQEAATLWKESKNPLKP